MLVVLSLHILRRKFLIQNIYMWFACVCETKCLFLIRYRLSIVSVEAELYLCSPLKYSEYLSLHGGKRISNNKSPTSSLVLIHRLSRLSVTTHYLKRPLSRNLVTYLKMDRKPWLVCTHYHNAQLKFVVVTMFRHAFFLQKPLHKQCLVFRHKVLSRIIPSSLPHIFLFCNLPC